MAKSDIAGDYDIGTKITCILNEGNPTVGNAYDGSGKKTKSLTWASELHKDELVTLDASTSNTHEATDGMPVVKTIANSDTLIIGKIVSEPELVKRPATSAAADSLTKRLAGEYYRIATVRLFVPHIEDATLVTADAAAIVPGVTGKLIVDVSESVGGENGLILNDIASGGSANIIPLTYAAKAAGATVSVVVAITGMLNGQT